MAWIALVLFIYGLAAGSFVNALVWRLHENKRPKAKKLSVVNGRSMCPHCRHQLAWYDLVPLLSWLQLRGRCRYCKKPISKQYPIVEVLMGLVFAGSYLFWPASVHTGGQWLLLAAWLICSVWLLALAVYDVRWTLLPSVMIYPALAVAVAARAAYIIAYEPHKGHALLMWLFSLLVASGVFWLIYVVGERYKKELIGYGDVRLGLLTGTLLATPSRSFLMIFLASVIGTLAVLPDLAQKKKTMASRLPYGPFLIIATAIVIIFGGHILDWYQNLMGINSV